MGKIKVVATWVVAVLLGALFVLSGSGKFMQMDMWQERFINQWGLPGWLALITAVMELVGGLMLFVPKTAFYGAGLIILAMIGATGAHLMASEWGNATFPPVLIALAAFVAYQRRPKGAAGG